LAGPTQDFGKSLLVSDPVSAASGAYLFTLPFFNLGGPMALAFELSYRSDIFRGNHHLTSAFWWRPFGQAIVNSERNGKRYTSVFLPQGHQISFQKTQSGDWIPTDDTTELGTATLEENVSRVKYQFKETTDFGYLSHPLEERVYIFERYAEDGETWAGRLARIMDRKGNQLTYRFADPGEAHPTRVEDGLGRALDFTYHKRSRIDFPDSTFARYSYDENGNMVSRVDREGKTWNFAYNALGQVSRIENPTQGVSTYTYNADGTLQSEADSDGVARSYEYDVLKRLTKLTHGDGKFVTYDSISKGRSSPSPMSFCAAMPIPMTRTGTSGQPPIPCRKSASSPMTRWTGW